jgi:hypothetical protein
VTFNRLRIKLTIFITLRKKAPQRQSNYAGWEIYIIITIDTIGLKDHVYRENNNTKEGSSNARAVNSTMPLQFRIILSYRMPERLSGGNNARLRESASKREED